MDRDEGREEHEAREALKAPHFLRMKDEHAELAGKLSRLVKFIDKSTAVMELPREERALLAIQRDAMATYARVLGERIERVHDRLRRAVQS